MSHLPFSARHYAALVLGLLFCLPSSLLAADADSDFKPLMFEAEHNPSPFNIDFSGSFQSSNRMPVHSNSDPLSLRQRLWGEVRVNEGGDIRAFVSGYVESDLAVHSRHSEEDDVDAAIHEAYMTIDSRYVDIIAGLQQIRWAEADSMSTVDIINPVDYRDPIATARSSQRLSVPAVDIRSTFGAGLFDLVVVPVPRFSKLPDYGSPWENQFLHTLHDTSRLGYINYIEEDEPDTPEIGLRLKLYQQGYDLGFIFYKGYEHTPLYSLSFNPQNFRPTVTSTYKSYETYALTAAVSLNDGTIRAEAAYKHDYPFQAADISIACRDDYQFLLGWDKTYFTNFNVNVQGFFFDYEGNKEIPGVDKHRYGISMGIENKFFDEAWRTGLRGVYYMNNTDATLEWFNEYDYDDHWKFNFGYIMFCGDKDGSMGQYRDNNHVYAGFKYLF